MAAPLPPILNAAGNHFDYFDQANLTANSATCAYCGFSSNTTNGDPCKNLRMHLAGQGVAPCRGLIARIGALQNAHANLANQVAADAVTINNLNTQVAADAVTINNLNAQVAAERNQRDQRFAELEKELKALKDAQIQLDQVRNIVSPSASARDLPAGAEHEDPAPAGGDL